MTISMRTARPFLALLILALVAFWPLVLHPTETLYSDTNDLLAEHLPAKLFLVRSLRETGELPLWNPEQYAGSPFVHDIQVGLFYPPHLPLYWMSEPAVGPFLSWLVFGHVVLAGWLMYAYGRHAGLGEAGAFTAAVGFMLAPRWLMQLFLAGHTVTAGIAWLPLVMLCVERAIQRRSLRWTVGGGVAYALLILGTHPQWTFYASLLIGLWPLRLFVNSEPGRLNGEPGCVSAGSACPVEALPALTQPGSPLPRRTLLARWLVVEAAVVLVGVALCAVQLLPTLEAAGETSRSRGMARSWSLPGGLLAATTLVGPFPERVAAPVHWESRGAIGFTWAVLALAAWWIGGRAARVPALIALGLLVFALGGSALFDRLPGFSTFRMPTRMLLTLTFPVAFLAGMSVRAIQVACPVSELRRATTYVAGVALAFGSLAVITTLFGVERLARLVGTIPPLGDMNPGWYVYWPIISASWGAFLAGCHRLAPSARGLVLVGILVLDVVVLVVPYPSTRPVADVFPPSPLIDYIRTHNPDGHRVYDTDTDDEGNCLLGPGSPAASVHGVPSVRGFNPLDVTRYRQFLAYVADRGEPQKAFFDHLTHPVTRELEVRNRALFDLLGVRYVVTTPADPLVASGWARRETDQAPRSYNFRRPGIQRLPPLTLYENEHVRPRAFVVVQAFREESEADVLSQLKGLDLRLFATTADWESKWDRLPDAPGRPGPAAIRSHSPNGVTIDLDGRTSGLLVLTDPWYPGWVCRVDGTEVPIWRADYAFRGVRVWAGTREVVFRFEPKSYRRGKGISMIAVGFVLGLFAAGAVRRFTSRAPPSPGRRTPAR